MNQIIPAILKFIFKIAGIISSLVINLT